MTHIKYLKEKFDVLPVAESNIHLYERLLDLDLFDFKPIMEAILEGRLDIEDTRQIFTYNGDIYPSGVSVRDSGLPPISDDVFTNVKTSTVQRYSGDPDIVKESLIYPNMDDIRHEIAETFFERTGQRMTEEDIDAVIPPVLSELVLTLNLADSEGLRTKQDQLIVSDRLSYKPVTDI